VDKNVKSQLEKYNTLLVNKNRVLNLTAHKTIEDSWKYNVCDSILFANVIKEYVQSNLRHLDIGSGGGAPAILLKICIPELDTTMIDSVGKKVLALNEMIETLRLDNIRSIHARVEDFCVTNRESFNIVTARAVAPLTTLVEYALPLLKIDGYFLAYKGKSVDEEIETASKAIKILGGKIDTIKYAKLDDETVRALVIIKKVSLTPKNYPRGKNLPRTKPLLQAT